ncbi:MAG: enoyl-CoA hydratase/isomerase family protein [Burkholderiaceae bacterium]|nr:enoyl-CoA hydratase/isomerase family protein [Burkholderiaceae bacterium]
MAGAEPTLQIAGAVATVTLRRPVVANRLELEDLARLQQFLQQVDDDASLRVLLLRGEGRHFCSGFNVERVGADGAAAGPRFEALADALEQARPVTVLQLQGGAYGGAVDLALAADFRIGGPASELRVPAARLGLHFYRGGLERAVARIGLPWARRLFVAADTLDATTLHGAGLLDRLADSSEAVEATATGFCEQLAGLAPLALLGMKKHLNRIARGRLDAQDLARDIAAADASADLQEGARAWREKRPPRFEGR